MYQASKDSPLDSRILPTSNNWVINMKEPRLGNIGKPTIETKKQPMYLRLRPYEGIIDVVAHRREQRIRIMNAKAKLIDEEIGDAITLNEVERKFVKQKQELQRLENVFANGVLSNVFFNAKNKALQLFQNDVLEQDPELQSFDKTTDEIMKQAVQLQKIQQTNDEIENDLRQSKQEIRNTLGEMISGISTGEQYEEVASLAEQFKQIEGELVEEPIITQAKELSEELIEDNIRAEEAKRETLEAQEEIAEELKTRLRKAKPATTALAMGKVNFATELAKRIRQIDAPVPPALERRLSMIEKGQLKALQEKVPRPKYVDRIIGEMQDYIDDTEAQTSSQAPTIPKKQ